MGLVMGRRARDEEEQEGYGPWKRRGRKCERQGERHREMRHVQLVYLPCPGLLVRAPYMSYHVPGAPRKYKLTAHADLADKLLDATLFFVVFLGTALLARPGVPGLFAVSIKPCVVLLGKKETRTSDGLELMGLT